MKFVALALISLYIVVPANGGIAITHPTLPIISTYPVLNTGVEYYYGTIPTNSLNAYHKTSQVQSSYNRNQNAYKLSIENARRRLYEQDEDLENGAPTGDYYYSTVPRKSLNYLSSYQAGAAAESNYKHKNAYNYHHSVGSSRRNLHDAGVVVGEYDYPTRSHASSYKKTTQSSNKYNKKNAYKYQASIASSRRNNNNNNDEEVADDTKENEASPDVNNCDETPLESKVIPTQTYNDEDRLNFIKDICLTYIEKNNFFTDLIGDAKIQLFIADISDLLNKHCLEDDEAAKP